MRSDTEPGPLPCAPEVMVIHDALLFAVHVQPFNVDTAMLAVFASELTVWAPGIVMRHGAASCITRTWSSLTTMSPSRTEGALFAAARNARLPLPCPDVGEISEIHAGWLDTVHAHSGCAVNAIVPDPPSAVMFAGWASVS